MESTLDIKENASTINNKLYNKCIRVLLKDKNKILFKLDEYSKIWDSFLDEKIQEFEQQEYIDYIKKQSNKIIKKIDNSVEQYYNQLDDTSREQIKNIVSEIKSHLKLVVINILVNIKNKVAEIEVFKNKIDIRKLLTEDKYILKEREKKKILDDIDNILLVHAPTLTFFDTIPESNVDTTFVLVNNSLYYTKKCIKDIKYLFDLICTCDIQHTFPESVLSNLSRIENHLLFLRTKFSNEYSKELLINYILDNNHDYHNNLLFLQELYTEITQLFHNNNNST